MIVYMAINLILLVGFALALKYLFFILILKYFSCQINA